MAVDVRSVERDVQVLTQPGVRVQTRDAYHDIGPTLTHKVWRFGPLMKCVLACHKGALRGSFCAIILQTLKCRSFLLESLWMRIKTVVFGC
ncbi:hypothetical protein [Geomicrobium halophilum]|uniref:hypothetical protein n=1 Tax=Geomicrobium halophilum TaxID=549000 RepID=UPI00161CB9BC